MTGERAPADRFEEHRPVLRSVAEHLLGSASAADDAVQETWLRFARADTSGVTNLGGWLRTVASRVCLDMLRAQAARREDAANVDPPNGGAEPADRHDAERDAELADTLGRALLVVLNTLEPDERVAVVLHDMFDVPFDEIAPIVGRNTAAAKKLASRARGRVRAKPLATTAELARHRRLVDAFLAASRAGDVQAVMAVLASDVVRRADAEAVPHGRALEVRGARDVANEIVVFGANARFAEAILVNGALGLTVAPRGRLVLAIVFTFAHGAIAGYELIAAPARLARLTLSLIDA